MAVFRRVPLTGALNAVGIKKSRFSTNITISQKWHRPWTIPNPDSIIWRWTTQKRYEIHTQVQEWRINREGLIHALLKGVISNDLEWLSEIFNETKHRCWNLWLLSTGGAQQIDSHDRLIDRLIAQRVKRHYVNLGLCQTRYRELTITITTTMQFNERRTNAIKKL